MSTYIVMADAFLDALVDPWFAANGMKLKLYCNNHSPARGDTPAAFTEASGGGYAEKTIAADSHTVETSLPHDFLWDPETFTFTGPLTTNPIVYGYYVTDNAGTTLLWAQALDTPFTPVTNGDYLTIDPFRLQYSGGVPA